MAIKLSTLTRTTIGETPPLITLYGTDGVGKSKFGLDAPSVAYLPTEQRFGHFSVMNVFATEDNPNEICSSFGQMMEGLTALLTQDHKAKTAVIDGLDHLEPLVWDYVVEQNPRTEGGKEATSIEAYGYGKGYVLAENLWREFFRLLNRLRNERDMTIVLLAHYFIKEEATADGEAHQQFQIKLHKKASALTRENSDVVLFAQFKKFIVTVGDGLAQKNQARTDGSRIIICQPKPSCVVKNSFDHPAELPLDWAEFAKYVLYLNKEEGKEDAA